MSFDLELSTADNDIDENIDGVLIIFLSQPNLGRHKDIM